MRIVWIGFWTYIVYLCVILLINNGYVSIVYPDSAEYPVRGIDVSHHQGEMNWDTVIAHDFSFAYIKATEADDHKDTRFDENWRNSRASGIIRGAYHFYSLRYGGEEQAQNFIDSVPRERNMLPPAIDLEYGGNSIKRPSKQAFQHELNKYINTVREHYNKDPVIYTTYSFFYDYLYPEFDHYSIWIRDLYFEPSDDLNWVFWQYNPRGKIEGLNEFVDFNVFRGSRAELIQFTETSTLD